MLTPQIPFDGQIPQDPESLIDAMERVTVLFDRICKGFSYEARVITRMLPTFLADFFPPQDIMNKVIGEFLSAQQPHPQFMAKVVFQVFEQLLQRNQHALLRDWVMLSLSNFTQCTPVAMAIWSLTCFFISASTNPWLRALKPSPRHTPLQHSSNTLLIPPGNQTAVHYYSSTDIPSLQPIILPTDSATGGHPDAIQPTI